MKFDQFAAYALAVLANFSSASVIALTTLNPTTAAAQGGTMNQIAKGTFEVKMSPLVLENAAPEAKLARMSIDKKILGDLTASTKGQMLSAMTATKGSAGYVALEHVSGTLNGKSGSFVLQHTGIMNRGIPSLSVVVVPDSGTGELTGIDGTFKINIVEGKHLYEFTYQLPSVK